MLETILDIVLEVVLVGSSPGSASGYSCLTPTPAPASPQFSGRSRHSVAGSLN